MNQFRHIANRIASMLGVGRITAMNDSGTTQSVQYQTPSCQRTPTGRIWLFFRTACRHDVVLAFLGGDRSSPVVIATNHQGFRHADLQPGRRLFITSGA
jgi:phage gp45-like